ncbi:MAG: ubiquitin carboxyl-terminal hydrolase [Parachlamydiaceae bacterium]|nr:ubiquitin carboxyl-terminal hydrolase [Parachlamydiaceae bacterium]
MANVDLSTFKNLNIHFLTDKKQKFESEAIVENFIKKIIKIFNDTLKESPQEAYENVELNRWDKNDQQKFCAKVYYSKAPIKTSFAQWVTGMSDSGKEEFQSVRIRFVFFLYRKFEIKIKGVDKAQKQWDLFALTTDEGWRVVKPYTNFEFPTKIALRIVDPRLSGAEKKPLAGHTDSSNEIYRNEYSLLQNEMETVWKWFKGFHSHFKTNSSLYNDEYDLEEFVYTQTQKELKKNTIGVHIGGGKISIAKPLTMTHYLKLLIHFSRIYHGEKTFVIDGGKKKEEIDDPGIQSLENIQLVEDQLITQLNNGLLKVVWKCFDPKQPLGGLTFMHRFYKDFYNSGLYCLKFGSKEMEWNYRPSIFEIMECLRDFYGPTTDYASFYKKLETTRFKYNSKKEFFPIVQFFHGELRINNEVYFRVDGLWLKVCADQLAILQRDFHMLLNDTLLNKKGSNILTKPWIAKVEWTAFDVDQMALSCDVSVEDADKFLKKHLDKTFSFIDKDGKVLYNYPTQCLLDESKDYVPTLKKRWENLASLLSEKHKEKEAITIDDLEEILKLKKKGSGDKTKKWAKELMSSLKKERPIIVKLSIGKAKKIALVDEKGIPRFPNASNFSYDNTALKTHKIAIDTLLSTKFKNKEPLTLQELKDIESPITGKKKTKITKIQERSAIALWKKFQLPKALNKSSAIFTSKYVVQGDFATSSSDHVGMAKFLVQRHKEYKLTFEEEGYNRLYLNLAGYIVGDQSYANKAEKVELFDILHYGDKKKDILSLIHVKEGFGQKTREACAQIRVAAVCISNALQTGDGEILRDFYNQIVKSKEIFSPFRKKLRSKMKKEFPQETDFIQMFQDKMHDKQISFVYAFIDGSDNERLLTEEKSPSKKFNADDFLKVTDQDPSEAKIMFKALQDHKCLDEHGRLTAHFFRMTQIQFNKLVKDKGPEIFKILSKHVSQFDSLVAKIELLELRKFLVQLGFNFNIKQIQRSSLKNKIESNQTGWTDIPEDEFDVPLPTIKDSFEYNKVKYDIQKMQLKNENELIAFFLKINPKDVTSIVAGVYQLLIKHKDSKLVKEYLGKETSLQAILKNKFDKKDYQFVATALNLKITILQKKKDKVLADSPEVINKNGKNEFIFIENNGVFQQCILSDESESYSDSETEAELTSFSLSQNLGETDRAKLFSMQEVNIGLPNQSGQDCFFNAISQLILHSRLLTKVLSDKGKLCDKIDPTDTTKKDFFDFWDEFALSYKYYGNSKNGAMTYPWNKMRKLLNFSAGGQEDAAEAFTRILTFYNTNELELFRSQHTYEVDLSQKMVLVKKKASVVVADDKGCVIGKTEPISLLPIVIPDEDNNVFQKLLDSSQKVKEDLDDVDGLKFSQEGDDQQYFCNKFTKSTSYKCIADEIFLQVKRFEFNQKTGEIKKIKADLGIKAIHTINKKTYALSGFVIHIGNSPNRGHYIAFCKTSKGWLKFNDNAVPEKIKDADAIEQANQAYILHFKKVEKKKADEDNSGKEEKKEVKKGHKKGSESDESSSSGSGSGSDESSSSVITSSGSSSEDESSSEEKSGKVKKSKGNKPDKADKAAKADKEDDKTVDSDTNEGDEGDESGDGYTLN